MKKFNAVLIAVLFAVIAVLSAFLAACTPSEPSDPNNRPDRDVCDHSLTQVAAVRETCTTDGNLQYWFCSKCGKYFADGNAAEEIDENNTTIAAHHTLTHESGKKATCTTDGNIDYFHCSVCGENFLDEDGINKVDKVTLESTGHVVGEKWEYDEKGHWKVCGKCEQRVDYHPHNFEDYVCTDCGLVDEQNRPLSDEEIVDYVIPNIQNTLISALGNQNITQIKDILAIDFVEKENSHLLHLLVDYHTSWSGIESDFICLLEVPMATAMNKETIRSAQYVPIKNANSTKIININKNSDDDRGLEILEKINPDGDHDHYDFMSITKRDGATLQNLGITTEIVIYTISKIGLTITNINAQSGSWIGDCIENSILNGIQDKNYIVNFISKYKFNNVIYDFNGLL